VGPRGDAPSARFRAVAVTASLIAVVLLELFAVSAPPVKALNVAIHLYGRFNPPTGWSLNPAGASDPGPTLSVNQGDHVIMNLTSEDGTPHIFWIDYNGNGAIDTGEPESPQFTGTTMFSFDALQAGNFTYWCAIHKPTMRGTWVTNASGTTLPQERPFDYGPLLIAAIASAAVILAIVIWSRRRRR